MATKESDEQCCASDVQKQYDGKQRYSLTAADIRRIMPWLHTPQDLSNYSGRCVMRIGPYSYSGGRRDYSYLGQPMILRSVDKWSHQMLFIDRWNSRNLNFTWNDGDWAVLPDCCCSKAYKNRKHFDENGNPLYP